MKTLLIINTVWLGIITCYLLAQFAKGRLMQKKIIEVCFKSLEKILEDKNK